MFNFDTTFTKGKSTFKIVNNEIEGEYPSISAVAGNALINHWLDTIIEPQITRKMPSTNFETLVQELRYIHSALKTVNKIKDLNCSYRNKTREELQSRTHMIGARFADKIEWSHYSIPKQLILKDMSKQSISIASHYLQELYNPVTDDTSKLDQLWEEINSFDYTPYGLSKAHILTGGQDWHYTSISDTFKSINNKIASFQALVKEAGDDLLNWGEHKISRRFTTLGISCKYWEVSTYVAKYNQALLDRGLVRVDLKKSTSKGKLKEIIEKGNPTQDEYFRYYKQASGIDASNILPKLDLEHLYLIIESDLKCVTNKLSDNWESKTEDFKNVAEFLCKLSVTKEDFKKIFYWAGTNCVSQAFMIKHRDHATLGEVVKYCEVNNMSTLDLIDDEFYWTCLDKIPTSLKYNLQKGLTYQYMARMNDSERITFLEGIEGKVVSQDSLLGLYKRIPYPQIRKTILSNDDLKISLCGLIIINNDHEGMVLCGTTLANRLSGTHRRGLFERLTFAEKKQVILKDSDNKNYTSYIDKLTDSENLELLSEIINQPCYGDYVESIFTHLKGNKNGAIALADKIVRDIVNPNNLSLHKDVILSLKVDTKIELLRKGISLLDTSVYNGYSSLPIKATSTELGYNFFHDIKREDIKKICTPTSCEFYKFLGHTLTKQELESVATKEINSWHKHTSHQVLKDSFFRHNLDLYSYGFLKQFKVKQSFRKVVGDRRDTTNNRFGKKLLDKMKVSNSIDFMFS